MKSQERTTTATGSKHVLVILNNRLETVRLLRQKIYPQIADFDGEPAKYAVVLWYGVEVHVPLECVVFLNDVILEPKWIQDARQKLEQKLVSKFRESSGRARQAKEALSKARHTKNRKQPVAGCRGEPWSKSLRIAKVTTGATVK